MQVNRVKERHAHPYAVNDSLTTGALDKASCFPDNRDFYGISNLVVDVIALLFVHIVHDIIFRAREYVPRGSEGNRQSHHIVAIVSKEADGKEFTEFCPRL